MTSKLLRAALIAIWLIGSDVSAQTVAIYPSSASDIDIRHRDLIEILQTALQNTVPEYGAFTVAPSKLKMNEARSLAELKRNDSVTVVWSPTSEQLEQEYIPIRIPLRKGLLGLRVALIDAKNQQRFVQVRTLDDLKKIQLGMGIGWVDLTVLQANQMRVVTANYDALFAMTAKDRFDLFPRGINEVFNEYEQRRQIYPNLAIEKNLLLYYPWPYYFFVNKDNRQLADRLKLGLERMIDDGTFNRIFVKYNGAAIQRADLGHRHIIQLRNPFLPKQTPLDARYWFLPALIRNDALDRLAP